MGVLPRELPDLWAPVRSTRLPRKLTEAVEKQDWPAVRAELSTIMDAAITDGAYGRALLQLVLALPAGVDPLFDRYRVGAMVDHGDWDGIRNYASGGRSVPRQVQGVSDIITASVHDPQPPTADGIEELRVFEIYEIQSLRTMNRFKRWVQRISNEVPRSLWLREDVAIGRHLRYRRLHDTSMAAVGQAHCGQLEVAFGLASEAQRLGDAEEPLRFLAEDIANLCRRAMGDRHSFELAVPGRVCDPHGPSPVGAFELVVDIIAFLPLMDDESAEWSAKLLENIAARLASPRWELYAQSWRVAVDVLDGRTGRKTELAGLLARTRGASAGLKCLPTFLHGYAHRRLASFVDAERLARKSGNVWLQISALAWLTALDPRPRPAHRLRQLLEVTNWRRLVFVPTEIAADAALGMTSMGERSDAILEMALTADRPNVTTELVGRYIDDPKTPPQTRVTAVNALARVGTTHAREILSRLAQRRDEVGKAAAKTSEGPTFGLSEREIEVLSLAADGLTNKQIGEKLFLSPHTIARHLANARAKLGASNRAEAAVRLHQTAS